jgi:hypothetical protein
MSVILYPKAHSTNFFRINNFIEIAKPPDRNSAQVQRAVKGRHTKKKTIPIYQYHDIAKSQYSLQGLFICLSATIMAPLCSGADLLCNFDGLLVVLLSGTLLINPPSLPFNTTKKSGLQGCRRCPPKKNYLGCARVAGTCETGSFDWEHVGQSPVVNHVNVKIDKK